MVQKGENFTFSVNVCQQVGKVAVKFGVLACQPLKVRRSHIILGEPEKRNAQKLSSSQSSNICQQPFENNFA